MLMGDGGAKPLVCIYSRLSSTVQLGRVVQCEHAYNSTHLNSVRRVFRDFEHLMN
jgi:hypothetical protein